MYAVLRLIHHFCLAGTAYPAARRRLTVDTHIPRPFGDIFCCGRLIVAFEQVRHAADKRACRLKTGFQHIESVHRPQYRPHRVIRQRLQFLRHKLGE
ncbi:hypothetical protein EIL33_09260 [Salmonella enterica subsp. enterica serovar Molade]|nr:hypothetical protein [Salmonella enterica subsp. enterica serovar Molade]ECA0392947.1 hypothetical protein [Salmonella enterica subsp. enterica serovar Molade]